MAKGGENLPAANRSRDVYSYRGMKWTIVLVVAVAGCAGLNRKDPVSVAVQSGGRGEGIGEGEGLRVVTYNVHGQSAKAIAAAVRGDDALAEADVIFMQEVEERPRAPVGGPVG